MSEIKLDRDVFLESMRLAGLKVKKNFRASIHREQLEQSPEVVLCGERMSWRGECQIMALGGDEDMRKAIMGIVVRVLAKSNVRVIQKEQYLLVDFAGEQKIRSARMVTG